MKLDPVSARMRVDLGPPQCTGKDGYPSHGEALRVLRRLNARRNIANRAGRRGLRTYRCPHCRLWHLGSDAL